MKQAAEPSVDAPTELVRAQADTTLFVVLRRWAEILERHFRQLHSYAPSGAGSWIPLARETQWVRCRDGSRL
jgi:hypothetical protein